MTTIPPAIHFADAEDRDLSTVEGAVVVFADGEGALLGPAAALDAAMGGALTRVVEDKRWKPKAGTAQVLAFPAGLTATRVLLACLGPDPDRAAARKTGGAIAKALRNGQVTLAVSGAAEAAVMAETLFTMALRVYDFTEYKSKKSADDENGTDDEGWSVTVVSDAPEALAKASEPFAALAEGIYFTRDLVNEPA
ncbi:MAG: M17 family peptidase N-terminal domain-containing protein, partial [Pseudomonadota bacterium]